MTLALSSPAFNFKAPPPHETRLTSLADLGFFRGGDFENPSERSERALKDLARGGAQNGIEIVTHIIIT